MGVGMNIEYDGGCVCADKYNADDDGPLSLKRKVTRGGSWKDVAYFIQNGSRSYEYQDTSKSYVGFRCVQTYIGRSANDTR